MIIKIYNYFLLSLLLNFHVKNETISSQYINILNGVSVDFKMFTIQSLRNSKYQLKKKK